MKKIITLVVISLCCLVLALYSGWVVGYKDGIIATIAVSVEYLNKEEAMATIIRAKKIRNVLLLEHISFDNKKS